MSTRQNEFHTVLKELLDNCPWASIPCTRQQVNACEAAWRRLVEESWDEQALAILRVLSAQAKTQGNGGDWLTAELLFEVYAFALDNRTQAAVHYLQFSSEVTDETLDRYTNACNDSAYDW